MQAPSQPLPTYDEVLLCTPGTTFEEVALFLRRCLTLGSQEHKVYSLLYADQLSYEVGCQVEALFQSLCLQRHREDYKLVLVCDCDREHCYLPSAFSQYKVLVTPQASLESIQTYLVRHFRVPLQTPSAAVVFKDRVCVRVVASQRAGVGKITAKISGSHFSQGPPDDASPVQQWVNKCLGFRLRGSVRK
uniref:RN213 ligase n=1 Tax=Loxodonta africana TaxID=9785 RepID=G3UCA0_LOXAF